LSEAIPQKRGRPQVSNFKELSSPGSQDNSRQTKARFAAKVLDQEWTGDPIITSIPRILSALHEGKVVPGNLVISGDEIVVDELKQIWSAYDLTDDMTVGIIAPPNSVFPSLSVWWSLDRRRSLPFRYKLKLHQMADFDGPCPKPPQTVQMLHTQGPRLVTLRVLAPWHFRQGVAGVDKQDTPSSVIAELAQQISEPVSHLTGGRWEKLAHPKGELLVAHLRVPERVAAKVTNISGKPALFSSVLTKERAPVDWVPRVRHQTDVEYFRAASVEASKKGVPLVFRQGGSSDLGLSGIGPRTSQWKRKRAWELFGAPSLWNQETVAQFLQSEGWKETTIRTRKKRQGQGVWLFQAFCPPFQTPDEAFWHLFGNIAILMAVVTPLLD